MCVRWLWDMVFGKSAQDMDDDLAEQLLAQVRHLKGEMSDLWAVLREALEEGITQDHVKVTQLVLDAASRYEEIAALDMKIDGHREQAVVDARAAETPRVPDGYHQLCEDVAQLRADLAGLQSGITTERRLSEGLRQTVDGLVHDMRVSASHLVKVNGVPTSGGVYNQIGVLRKEMRTELATLRAEMIDVARREAILAAERAVSPVRDNLSILDDSWRNLRAERVRADAGLLREQDHAHHPLASELTNLGTQKARALVTSARPHAATSKHDPITAVAMAVREILQACLTGPMVDDDGVRNVLGGDDADLEPGDLSRLRRFVDAATRLRARIAAAGREVEFDFTLPEAGAEYQTWHPSTEDGMPSFVVVPAYRVGGHPFGLPVVFTELPAGNDTEDPRLEVAGD